MTKSGRMKLFPHNFGETHNQIENPPGCVLSDIKRRSSSILPDRIPQKRALLLVSEMQNSVAVGYVIGMVVGVSAQ